MEEKDMQENNVVDTSVEKAEIVNTSSTSVETTQKTETVVEKKKNNKFIIGGVVAVIIIAIGSATVYGRLAPERAMANTVEEITKEVVRNSDTEVTRFAMENDFNNINVYAGNEEPVFEMNVNRSEVQTIEVDFLGLPIKLYSDKVDAILNFGSDNYYRFDSQNAGVDVQEYAEANFGTSIPNMEYLNLFYDNEDKSFNQPAVVDDSVRAESYQKQLNEIVKQLLKSCTKTSTGKTEVVIDDETYSTKGYLYSANDETLDIYMKDLIKLTMLYSLQTNEDNINSPIDVQNEQFLNEEDAQLYDGLVDYLDSTEIMIDVNVNIKDNLVLLMEVNTTINDTEYATNGNYSTSIYFVDHKKILNDIRIMHSVDGSIQQMLTFGMDKEGTVQSGHIGFGSAIGMMTTNLKDATQYTLINYSQDFATRDYDNGLITFDVNGEVVEYVYTYNVIDDKLVFKVDTGDLGLPVSQFQAVVSNENMTHTMPTPTAELNDVTAFEIMMNEPKILETLKQVLGLAF